MDRKAELATEQTRAVEVERTAKALEAFAGALDGAADSVDCMVLAAYALIVRMPDSEISLAGVADVANTISAQWRAMASQFRPMIERARAEAATAREVDSPK